MKRHANPPASKSQAQAIGRFRTGSLIFAQRDEPQSLQRFSRVLSQRSQPTLRLKTYLPAFRFRIKMLSSFLLILGYCTTLAQDVESNIELFSKNSPKQQKISMNLTDVSLREMLSILTEKTGVNFVYSDNLLPDDLRITLEFEEKTVIEILEDALKDLQIDFVALSGEQIVITEKTVLHSTEKSGVRISGHVVDDSTGLPLENVNVFIANSMMGAATDKDGNYVIKGVHPGTYKLVASMIGYRVQKIKLRLTESIAQHLNIRLKSMVIQMPGIEISAAEADKWRKNLRKFTQQFLSTSRNASECKILNPEVLDFEEKTRTQPFIARAQAPLQIENRALGYQIYFVLEMFNSNRHEVVYLGQAKFEELIAKDSEEEKKWLENRQRAYNGSLRHFLAALSAHRVAEEGFLLYKFRNSSIGYAKVDHPDFISRGELPFERRLSFKGYLKVVYPEELEEDGYVDHRFEYNPSIILGTRGDILSDAREPREQRSTLTLNRNPITIDVSGHIPEPLSVTEYGYWAWERVAELLPLEYSPPNDLSSEKYADPDRYIDWLSLEERSFFTTPSEKPVDISDQPVKTDFYEHGIRLRDNDDWENALKVWWRGRNYLETHGKVDPRIGIAFVELVTHKAAMEYFEAGSDIYFWGFSRASMPAAKKTVTEEAARIMPLLDEQKAEAWRELMKTKDAGLSHKISCFWIEKDSRPTTRWNERLIEHWERIAYAREHFRKNSYGVYDCDDRGTIYVKYGPPLRQKSGTFGTSAASTLELSLWIESSYARSNIKLWDKSPDYEVWLYSNLDTDDPCIFLFANREGSGSFGLREGIESAITRLGYFYDHLYMFRYIYQIMYYAELRSFAGFFDRRYDRLEEFWHSAQSKGELPSNQLLRSIANTNELLDRTNPMYKYAIADLSSFEQYVDKVNIVTQGVRLLDNRNQPKLAVIATSSPQLRVEVSEEKYDEEVEIPDYRLKHLLIVRDDSLKEVARRSLFVPEGLEDVSVFRLNHLHSYTHYTVAAEAFTLKSDSLLAIGKTIIQPGKPLNSHPDSLEVSDLTVGLDFPTESDISKFPFPFLPTRRIWKKDLLKVYLEVYHLQPDAHGVSHFSIDYSVSRLDKKGRVIKKEGEITLTFNFETPGHTSKEHSAIDIRKLKPGRYQLLARVKDRISFQEKVRTAEFTVVE